MPTITLTDPSRDNRGHPVTLSDHGNADSSTVYVVLHGGGGSGTVIPFAEKLAGERSARVVVPIHPGFDGTERRASVSRIAELAALYAALPEALGVNDVTVIGNSIGGWIAAELGLLGPKTVSRIVLVDAVGIEVPDHPVVDFFALSPSEIAAHSYADPDRFGINPATLTPEQLARMAANRETLAVYGGRTMTDPTLSTRLRSMAIATLVVWGEADRIVDPDYGRAFAAAIPGATYQCLAGTGHLPQIETPGLLIDTIAPTV